MYREFIITCESNTPKQHTIVLSNAVNNSFHIIIFNSVIFENHSILALEFSLT